MSYELRIVRGARTRRVRGYTFTELLTSASLAVILAATAIFTLKRSTETAGIAFDHTRIARDARAVFSEIARDARSAAFPCSEARMRKDVLWFEGFEVIRPEKSARTDEKEAEYEAVPMPFVIRYVFEESPGEGKVLMRWVSSARMSAWQREVICRNVAGVEFKYRGRGNQEWLEQWDDTEELPAAVMVTLTLLDRNGFARTLSEVVPVGPAGR